MSAAVPAGAQASAGLSSDEVSLQVVLTCQTCTHRYQPGPEGYRTGRTACPQCKGYVFTAELGDPAAKSAPCAHDWRTDLNPVDGAPIRACGRCERIEPRPVRVGRRAVHRQRRGAPCGEVAERWLRFMEISGIR